MGKLGGRELNYASDVDVLFVHREAGAAGEERAGRAAAALIDLLSAPGPDGIALRVDPDLRPEGRAGPLSRSLDAMARLLRAARRHVGAAGPAEGAPVAGDPATRRSVRRSGEPFVYPAVLPAGAIEDVRASKARIEENVRAPGKEGRELKRGRGGIRDVEFAVQLLQLVHGRPPRRLRQPKRCRRCERWPTRASSRRADADALADSYRFLRRLEHRLQMVRDLQTHELPRGSPALTTLARVDGLADAEALRAEHARTRIVCGLHERLFYRPLLEAFAVSARPIPARTGRTPRTCSPGSGSPTRPAAYGAAARVVDPSTRLGQVLDDLFPVIGPALAEAERPTPR